MDWYAVGTGVKTFCSFMSNLSAFSIFQNGTASTKKEREKREREREKPTYAFSFFVLGLNMMGLLNPGGWVTFFAPLGLQEELFT